MSMSLSMSLSSRVESEMVKMMKSFGEECVKMCASKYNFDVSEALKLLELESLQVSKSVKKEKTKKEKTVKCAFPLPYNGEFNDSCCFALRQNNGLYTQCQGIRIAESSFCKGCANQMQKTGSEQPEYGTIQQRMAVGIFEYVDPKGRKPTPYTKIMKKLNLTKEQVLEEALKLNISVNEEHFVEQISDAKRGRPSTKPKEEKAKGPKGRPKKAKKVIELEGDEEDLFATLVAEANKSEETASVSEEASVVEEIAEEVVLDNKAEKKAAAEKEKAEKKAAAEKAKAEKEAKKAEKEAKKSEKEAKKSVKKDADEEEEEQDVVKKIEFEGKKYLKSKKTGIIYDYEEYVNSGDQVVLGKWSDEEGKIIFNKVADVDSEEEEEEYDE